MNNRKKLEQDTIQLLEKMRLKQWENYALDKEHDLNLINREIQELFVRTGENNPFSGRKKEIFQRFSFSNIVENDPQVAFLRNRIDNLSYYEQGLDKSDPLKFRLQLAKRTREDVLRLMEKRNSRAQKLGFSSYPDLIFYAEELNKEEVEAGIEKYFNENKEEAAELVKKLDLSWENWFEKLRKLGEKPEKSFEDYARSFFSSLGLDYLQKNISFTFKNQPIDGVVIAPSIPGDVRALLKPVHSAWGLKILLHECGHTLNYASQTEEGLYTLITTSFDESMAVIFEKIGMEISLEEEMKKIARKISLLEGIRNSISFMFEMALWKNPQKAEELYQEYYSLLPIDLPPKELWAVDSFRSLDPVYVHNFVFGEILAPKVIGKLKNSYGENFKKWGEVLCREFTACGRKRPWKEKITSFMDSLDC